MPANVSVLAYPFSASNSPDFEICDRRYGVHLDIPRCDVAAGQLDLGSASTTYEVNRQEGPHTLPRSLDYGQ